jgi:E3 Ubiquitin ligase
MSVGHGPGLPYWYWLATAAAATVALWALFKFITGIQRDRLVADTPLMRIRSAAQGYVKVFGHAKPAENQDMRAPLSSRSCVWWSYKVEEKIADSRGESHWRSIDSGTSVTPFVLADADGECLVGPIHAEITPTTHTTWYGEFDRPKGFVNAALGIHGTGKYRYTESLLSEGDRLSVIGELRSHSDVGDDDGAAGALLKDWKHDQGALLARFDTNHDGHIDAAEWEAARAAAVSEAKARAVSVPVTRTSVIGQPIHGQPYIIAALDSAHLVTREKRRALLYLGLGVLCTALCAIGVEYGLTLGSSLGR